MGAKLPIGIQDFESLRIDGYLYVDKTNEIYKLISSGRYYFLSRPRRFGKSMLISTIRAMFEGKRELFDGLAIASIHDFKWEKHPIFHLDFNTQQYDAPQKLENVLNSALAEWESIYGANPEQRDFGPRFEGVIRRAHEKTGKRAVILVDEYDKPMLQAISNPELQEAYRAILKGFYGALKSGDRDIKFALLTGVTKFGKISVFSDLNHLNDISMDPRYFDICGLTDDELHANFKDEIDDLAHSLKITVPQAYALLKENYDGYHFSEDDVPGIYNPFSILNAMDRKKIGSYWFETGTPTYLAELLKKHGYNLYDLEKEQLTGDELNCIDSASDNPIPVIYQSGYLTIKGYDNEFGLYRLGYPNKEVEEGFVRFLIPYYTNIDKPRSGFEIGQFVLSLRDGDVDGFMNRLQAFLSACPYELLAEQERHFQSVMYILTTLCGFYAEVEEHTSKGRLDMTVKTDKYIYVFEFKFNESARIALKQIVDKGYADKFTMDGREVICVGVNYSSAERNINQWEIG